MKVNIKKINILFLIMLMICIFNYKNSDYEGYKFIYNNLNSPEIILEKGYVFILKIIRYFTANYQVVVGIIGFFTLSLLSSIAKKMGDYQKFIGLYFIFPFFLDIIQIRFFLAYTIFLISISYFFEKKKMVLFILFLISIFIHKSVIIYYIPYIFIRIKKKQLKYVFIIFSIVSFIVVKTPILKIIISKIDAYRFQVYTSQNMNFGGYLYLILFFINFLLTIKSLKYLKNRKNENMELINYIEVINYFSLVLLPLFFLNSNFFRLYRPIIVLSIIVYSNIFKDIKIYQKIFIIIYLLILNILLIGYNLQIEIIKNNFILDYLK